MAKSRFSYRGRERTVEGELRHSKSSGVYDSIFTGGILKFKPKEGENCIRILPPTWVDDEELVEKWGTSWNIPVHVHYSVGPDNAQYLCLKQKGEDCPVCEARAAAESQEERKELRPGERRVVWVIDRNDEKSGPKAYDMPKTKIFDEIVSRSIDRKTKALLLIDDPEEGYDIVFTREGTDEHTTYSGVDVMRDPTPIHDDQRVQDKWEDYIADHQLMDILNYYDADYIENVLAGGRAAPRDEERDEGRERGGSRRPTRGEAEDDLGDRGARRRPRGEEERLVAEDGDRPSSRAQSAERTGRRTMDAESAERDPEGSREERSERAARPRRDRGDGEGTSTRTTTSRSDPDDDQGEGEADLRTAPRRSRGNGGGEKLAPRETSRNREPEGEGDFPESRTAKRAADKLRERRASK